MPKSNEQRAISPRGRLSRLDDNLLSVAGELHTPIGDIPRRMTVVRLRDSRLVIFGAIALSESELNALEDFGVPSYLIVSHRIHRDDAKTWKDRYPSLVVIAPAGARAQVAEVVHVDDSSADFGDPGVLFVTVPGTEGQEAALTVKTAGGVTLLVNGLIWNLDDRPGFGGWIFKAMGFTGSELRIPTMVELREVKHKHALQAQLQAWAGIPDLKRIIVSHGNIVTEDPAGVLARLAETLA